MSAEQIKALDAQGVAAKKEANLSKLRQLVRDAQQHAVKECGHGQDAFRDFMANQGVIPPSARPTPRELAESMTPGEAKALVQELVSSTPSVRIACTCSRRCTPRARPSWIR